MAHRAAKRPKLCQRGEDDYLPGNIVEIEIHNFMTYDHLKCQPGSRLNLVIGPNGSGKSSLVCAIALGLAGEPQLLGRASSVGAFVKRGEDSGYIKISLRGDTEMEKICITRKIDTSNKSEWVLNGVAVPKRDVVAVIQRFNIQVNNLTQFLPQDRVCEFAKMTPIQLLEETEKAVGNPDLPVQHQDLIEKSGQLKKLELSVKQNRDTLNQLKALNSEQEKDVERVRQRQKLLDFVELMKKKLPWLKYDMKKMEYMEAKKKEAEAKRKMDEAAKILKDLKKPVEEKKKEKAKHESTNKKASNQIDENAKKRVENFEKESAMGVQLQGKYAEMQELRRQEESRQQRIIKAKEELLAAEKELADYPIYEPPTNEIEKIGNQILELRINANEVKLQRREKENILLQKKLILKQYLDRLKEMENNNNKLLQALRNSGADKIFDAYKWVQEHRRELRQEVYGPVLLEVNVSDPRHATYLENHVPNYIWKSFITQDSADRDFLVRNLKSYNVPILNYEGSRGSNIAPFHVSHEMQELGICNRLDQVFDAPDAVKDVLISQAGLEHSYIGSHDTDQRADEVSRLGILDLWTPESHYRWSISRYGGHISASADPVHPSRLFSCSVDVGDEEKLKYLKVELEDAIGELEVNLRVLQAQQRQLEDEEANLHKQRDQMTQTYRLEKKKRTDLERLVVQRRCKLDSISKEDDLELGTKKLVDQANQLNENRFQMAIKIKASLIEAVALKWSFAEKYMMSIELDGKVREMEADIKQHEKSAIEAATHFGNCEKETEHYKQQLHDAKRHAESIAIITDELAREFLKMPGTVEELEAAIQDNISEANSILFLNQNILEEYEIRQRKIDALAVKLQVDEKELARCLDEINTVKENWLPMLRNLVSKINDTFSKNFQEMAVAGEVSLDEHDMDFDKYGILIKVKFRQSGQLQVLSAHHQSGGERSVSTILYLVSLQDLTNCPFRVVDEINQGMDPINERKMFQQLVRAASQLNTPQCFLLTPKLLPDLEYSNACSILNIMNGPWIEKSSKVWSNGECWRTVMGLAGGVS
ncbi:structural maintenance of chromosomes protein 5 isoform X2 [Canna indica]|uniref:Structural maintenance of chromosomes protein 5 n=1 Tax=Canna indica TaxID=4628 RepID=A0AAQ3Q3B3_9LILI|nr:structural maintenance of chromosomes protein 5 isoform X2 [Canna indica]